MNDLENELKRHTRSRPSDSLDRRVGAALAGRPAPLFSRPVPAWACGLAAAAGLAAGVLLFRTAGSPVAPETAEATSHVRLMLIAESGGSLPDSPFIGRRFANP